MTAPSNEALAGKVFLVTGATAGIGVVTASTQARQGATLVLVGRNPEKTAATVERIKGETGNAAVEGLVADLSSQREVRRLAQQFLERYPRLDVLVNNAGALFLKRRESVDGIEMTFALNHLAYFLLTELLLDRLRASRPARVVNVSSEAHRRVRLDFDDLQGRRRYRGWRAYCRSKLANLLFTYELARRLEGTGVTANALHPGVVRTDFARDNGWAGRWFRRFLNLMSITAEEGAQTTLYLAASPEVEGVTGKYYVNRRPVLSSPASYDREAAARLWQVSAEMTGLMAAADRE